MKDGNRNARRILIKQPTQRLGKITDIGSPIYE
jgi:hypothetical protein